MTMAPRRRDPKNRHLEGTNIKHHRKGGRDYYYYVMPDGKLEPLVHDDIKSSKEAAIALNQIYRTAGDVVRRIVAKVAKPTDRNPPAAEIFGKFRDDWLPGRGYSASYKNECRIKISRWETEWPHKRIGDLDTFTIAQFLAGLSRYAARQHRVLLDHFFRFAASNGYHTTRPMVEIERIKAPKRQRVRHTWDGYQAIYKASPAWLQRAQDAALYTLQRRSDLVAIRFDEHIDIKARTIKILQQKTRNYDKPVYIEIEMGDELYESVMASHWSGINCPYLIRHQGRVTAQSRATKGHPFAVTADYLTRAYSDARDRVGCYNHLPKKERPGIHSIRALGVWLYTKAGYSDEYIMALSGHAAERMKAHYVEGHEKTAPAAVEAGLSLGAVDLSEINWETDLSPPLQGLANAEG